MRLKIATKIILGFGVTTVAVIIYAFMTSNALTKSRQVTEEINSIYAPSVELISELETKISDSRMLIKSWVHIDAIADTPDKIRLQNLHNTEYQAIMDSLFALSENWTNDTHKKILADIHATVADTLFPQHKEIMDSLSTFSAYEDAFVLFDITPKVEDGGEVMVITANAITLIHKLLKDQEHLIAARRKERDDSFDSFRRFIYLMLFAQILVAIAISTLTILSLSRPINRTKNVLQSISKGILPDVKYQEGNDEIAQMSRALHGVVQSLKNVSDFTTQIGKGNFSSEFKPQSDEDILGQSLLDMRTELKKAKEEEEIRAEENRQRTWTSQGVAIFSDILRQHSDNIEELSFEIISKMVEYTNSNQGGIFIVNDNDKDNILLEMTACYAYDRKKFLNRKVEIGEGLVGRCYQEQEKIFLTDIPKDYIKISSGLGEESPNCLLLVPLAYNDNIFGIMEIASFNIYQEHEIEFMERIGESIAATISSVKANIQTQMLLEQSQQQAEEMSAQEEEMRQNMEELRATQEQSARREQELIREVDALKKQLDSV